MKDSLSGEVVRYSACDLFCVENLRKVKLASIMNATTLNVCSFILTKTFLDHTECYCCTDQAVQC